MVIEYLYASKNGGTVNAPTQSVVATAHADMTCPSALTAYNARNVRNTALLSRPASTPRCLDAHALNEIAHRCAISPTARSFSSKPYDSRGNITAHTYLYAKYAIDAYAVKLTPLTVDRGARRTNNNIVIPIVK